MPNRSKTEQTWYQFLLTNNSRSTSSHALLQVNMDSVGNEPTDCLKDIEGFDTRKIVLNGIGDGRAAAIEKIELFDYDNTTYTADTEANIVPSLTVGSDAHRRQDVGKGIQEAEKLLQELGFPYISRFRERKLLQEKVMIR